MPAKKVTKKGKCSVSSENETDSREGVLPSSSEELVGKAFQGIKIKSSSKKSAKQSQRGSKSSASFGLGGSGNEEPPMDFQGFIVDEVEENVSIAPEAILPPEDSEPIDSEWGPNELAESSTEIVRYDPLTAYLREISRYPQISKEEEFNLAVRYREHSDLKAAYKLVLANLWLVVKIARDYEAAARNVLDLIQEGNIGLMEAVKNFDPYKDVRLPSYAIWWIKAYIIRFIIANWRLIKIGTTQAQRKLFFNLKKEKERLEREGFSPMPKLIAERLNVRESDVIEMEQRLSLPEMSIDAPISQEDSDSNLGSIIPSGEMDAEEILSRKQTKELILSSLNEFSSVLNEKEAVIFRERLVGEEKATLHDLAERFSLSKERIRQLESRVKEKLKAFLIEKFGDRMEKLHIDL
ncbi:MAG: RNA polymerase factor sigma-32 [SAR324 cluster bacterium]|uniref:RNA polymerase sigma factor n=1 Tax=SAR324 cluster bacterium TaxID=2024889 RepID=A0A7X9FS72_9DELT|nr:RNA polymerase factor sigma-32 [SAR324 cluster bacterium]